MTNLTQTEFDAVVSLAMANDERHAAFILFSYYHAARRQEALALRGTDVINGTVRFKRAKQKRDPVVSVQPLFTRERELIDSYLLSLRRVPLLPREETARLSRLAQAGDHPGVRHSLFASMKFGDTLDLTQLRGGKGVHTLP